MGAIGPRRELWGGVMGKKAKQAGLGASAHNGNTVELAPVTGSSNGKKDSLLAEYQWEPGESGNPAGRPKTSDLKAEVRAFADEEDPRLRKTRLRQWLEIADRRARQGSPKHLEMLLSYGWGRPSQQLELEANLNFTDALTKMREKRSGLPVAASGNGDTGAATALVAAAAMPEQDLTAARQDDAEPPVDAAPRSERKVRIEL
jgi:hypothetical protein